MFKVGLKRKLTAMDPVAAALLVADYLEADAPSIQRFTVRELLTAVKGIGQERALRMETRAGCHARARFGGRRVGERTVLEAARLKLAVEMRKRAAEMRKRREAGR